MNDFFSGLFGHVTFAFLLGAVLLAAQGPDAAPSGNADAEIVVARASATPADLAELAVAATDVAASAADETARQVIELPQISATTVDPAGTDPQNAPLETASAPDGGPLDSAVEVVSFDAALPEAERKTIGVAPSTAPVETATLAPLGAPLAETDATAPPAAGQEFGIVTGSSVNLRSGPATSFGKVGRVVSGDILEITARDGAWVEILHPDTGARVWMHGNYIDAVS